VIAAAVRQFIGALAVICVFVFYSLFKRACSQMEDIYEIAQLSLVFRLCWLYERSSVASMYQH